MIICQVTTPCGLSACLDTVARQLKLQPQQKAQPIPQSLAAPTYQPTGMTHSACPAACFSPPEPRTRARNCRPRAPEREQGSRRVRTGDGRALPPPRQAGPGLQVQHPLPRVLLANSAGPTHALLCNQAQNSGPLAGVRAGVPLSTCLHPGALHLTLMLMATSWVLCTR